MSQAQLLLKRFGLAKAREHCQRPEDGCALYLCEKGHKNCAHSKGGACLTELIGLVEKLS